MRLMLAATARLTITLVLGVLVAACGDLRGGGPVAERTDSAGVTIVMNRGADRALEWTAHEVLDLGGADEGPEAFYRVSAGDVATDSAGRLYILDGGNHRVLVFDRDGTPLRTMGRQGGGPGEFQFPFSGLTVAPDGSVAVFDYGKAALVRFAPDGAVRPQTPLGTVPWRGLALTERGMIGVFPDDPSVREQTSRRLLVINGADTTEAARIAVEPGRMIQFESCPVMISMPALFEPDIIFAARGRMLATSRGAEYAITLDDGAGHTLSIRRDLEPVPATAELAARELPDSMHITAGTFKCSIPPQEVAEQRGFGAFVPYVKNIALAPDGTIWIERRTPHASSLSTIDLFTATGEYIGTLPTDIPFPAAFRGPDEIVTVKKDEMDLPHVRVLRLEREPT